ncbi:MAG: alpha/beta fold hydrolase [Elusimicrobiota bacterium]
MALFFIAAASRALAVPVHFESTDGIRIAADYTAAGTRRGPVFILLHGLGAGRGEWRVFQATLAARGYGSLALDARGHGESGGASYRTFASSAAWIAIEKDLDAAVGFLARRGVTEERIVLAGASIGANLCLHAAARRAVVPFVILLSPGINYQGVYLEPSARKFRRPIVAAAARDDPYAYKTLFLLHDWARGRQSALLSARSGHGVGLLEGAGNQEFFGELMRRIDRLVRTSSSAGPAGRRASP